MDDEKPTRLWRDAILTAGRVAPSNALVLSRTDERVVSSSCGTGVEMASGVLGRQRRALSGPAAPATRPGWVLYSERRRRVRIIHYGWRDRCAISRRQLRLVRT